MIETDHEEDHSYENVLVTLFSQALRTTSDRPTWDLEEARIIRKIRRALENVTPKQLESVMADFVSFALSAHDRMDRQRYMECINMYTNNILHWVCGHRCSARIVRTLMESISAYAQNQTNQLALAWRCFSPSYSPIGGMTSVMQVARNCQYDALKVLLQYGMLERERRPAYIIITILFDPPRLEDDNLSYDTRIQELKDCLVLCFRVLTHVPIADIEMQIICGWKPLIEDWKDHIPRNRYQDPCELSHLCRAVIRRSLLVRSLLPKGISALPLPQRLQSYLNLEG